MGLGPPPVRRGSATHTGCREALLRSSPKSRAARKRSLKAGISVSVAAKPSSDPPRLMRSGTAGQAAMAAAGAAPAKGAERVRAPPAACFQPDAKEEVPDARAAIFGPGGSRHL